VTIAILMAVAVSALFAVAIGLSLRDARDHHFDRARLVTSLAEESITRTLESTETTLAAIGAMARQTDSAPHRDDLREAFEHSLRFTPYIRQIVVTDRHGRIIADSIRSGERRTIDLDRLGHNSDDTAFDRLSSLELTGEIPGRYLPLVGASPDPSPRSIVAAILPIGPDLLVIGALNPLHFQGLLSLGELGPSSSVRLTRLDGTPIVVSEDPKRAVLAGRPLSLRGPVDEGRQSGQMMLLGGEWQQGVAIFRLSSRYPVAVVAAMSSHDGINAWLNSNGILLFSVAVSLGGLLIGGGLLLRESLRRISLQDQVRLLGLTQTVFAYSSEAMLITDADDRIVAANPTFGALTGYEPSLTLGHAPSDFLRPDDSGDRRGPSHWQLGCRSGEPRAVTVNRAPLGTNTTIITLNDITERIEGERMLREALQEAELANRAKSEFLAAMSHELRTPLNAILGFSEIIRDGMCGPITPEACSDYINDIHNSGAHLRDIINDLLDLARIEAGKLELNPRRLDLDHEIDTCVRLVSERAGNHRLSLTIARDEDRLGLIADQRVLRQMIFNLLSNAIKFTPPGGRVEVWRRRGADGSTEIGITDTGIGIAPELHKTIFEAYQRAPNLDVRQIEGSGLGLALVRTMMAQHGGRVALDSAPGRGSTFTLIFPPSCAVSTV
jgi:PAS domain S-box-containing protein